MVEEHLDSCETCRKCLNEIKSPNSFEQKAEELPMKKLKILLLRKKYRWQQFLFLYPWQQLS